MYAYRRHFCMLYYMLKQSAISTSERLNGLIMSLWYANCRLWLTSSATAAATLLRLCRATHANCSTQYSWTDSSIRYRCFHQSVHVAPSTITYIIWYGMLGPWHVKCLARTSILPSSLGRAGSLMRLGHRFCSCANARQLIERHRGSSAPQCCVSGSQHGYDLSLEREQMHVIVISYPCMLHWQDFIWAKFNIGPRRDYACIDNGIGST